MALVTATALSFFSAQPIDASAAPTPAGTPHGAPVSLQQADFLGVATLAGRGTAAGAGGLNDATPKVPTKTNQVRAGAPITSSPTLTTPNPVGRTVSSSGHPSFSFNGLDHADQRLAGTGVYANTQFSLEPPDQGLCVGGGFVLEAVNTAFQVFDTSGHALTAPEAFNQFFGRPPEIIRFSDPSKDIIGDFFSDPKCNFDPATNRFFMTGLQAAAPGLCSVGPFHSTVPCSRAHIYLAVSQTPDPTGAWNMFSIDATDDGLHGTPNHSNSQISSPFFGDQPLLGTNADAVIITTNEYGVATAASTDPGNPEIGTQIYAISKSALVAAGNGHTPAVAHLNVGDVPMLAPDCCAPFDELQPAVSPTAAGQPSGVEYFLSTFTNHPGVVSGVNAWALTGTNTLTSGHPSLNLLRSEVASEPYAFDLPAGPPGLGTLAATQKEGPRPLADLLVSLGAGPQPLPELNGNDTRMQQVVYAAGKLWGGINTAVASSDPNVLRVGIAYFVISPTVFANTLSASMFKQGYLAVDGNSTMFPSIAVNQEGVGAMAFTLVGPNYYPSSAYVVIRPNGNLAGSVVVTGAGAGPDDGFTGYPAESGIPSIVGRWGDYSAAVTDANGTVWLASEYIPNAPRTLLANWGTYITNVGG